jgi:hypothetical protein
MTNTPTEKALIEALEAIDGKDIFHIRHSEGGIDLAKRVVNLKAAAQNFLAADALARRADDGLVEEARAAAERCRRASSGADPRSVQYTKDSRLFDRLANALTRGGGEEK